jgi:serine/threonine protein kinase
VRTRELEALRRLGDVPRAFVERAFEERALESPRLLLEAERSGRFAALRAGGGEQMMRLDVARAGPRRTDHPGFDLWGLAVVAFEALTGVHPFERSSAPATLTAIRAGWTDALRSALPPDALPSAALFESALARERSARPETATELAEHLEKTLAALR